ncbi:MAG: hypothetical protein ACJA09_002769 [Alcanivorax sp.]|jgi:hypothetical protein
MRRLHIVGCPRSGTTLLMELLTTCFYSSGYCSHEVSIFATPEIDSDFLYITKQPNDIKQISHIFPRDPMLHIIYMGRDPRAVVSSMHRERPGEYFCNYRVWQECDRAATRYAGNKRFLGLRYEDLVADPNAVQQSIANRFTFLERLHDFSDYQQFAQPSVQSSRAMNGLRGVDPNSLNKWRDHLPRIAEQLARHPSLAQDLIRLNYEPDDQWLETLIGVKPELFPCRYPERRPLLKEWEKSLRVYIKSGRYLKTTAGA